MVACSPSATRTSTARPAGCRSPARSSASRAHRAATATGSPAATARSTASATAVSTVRSTASVCSDRSSASRRARRRDRRRLASAAVADKVVTFRPFPGRTFTITGSSNDIGVVGEIERSGGAYQRELTPFLRRVVPRDGIVVDGGAHIGVMTTLFAGLCPHGRVFAFEPTDESHGYLVRNVAANDLRNVTVEKVALFDRDTDVALDANAVQPGGAH